ncbi:pyridoxal phosphate-dependent aminotransferase [Gluconobacter wancherniae]|uniref:pyridoxal phosphate-dependent aminotransferase n=1 Tax=Gluconobacter wancherniae TaxID=1307955 RepID=UPI001B8CCAEE|nr:pyridoxal phosphate-dependent aminotransferase [Gluconobacter wancherniae]MBS1088880.1 pyridoxal phosphate-dependent aminotransferase [Gluconobacter wancherniae]
MTVHIASRLATLPKPATIAMAARARELRAEGADVISLALGQPDFPSPPEAIEAAYHSAQAGDTGYPPIPGQKALIEAIIRKFRRDNAIEATPDRIMVANGGKQVIFNAFMATLEIGDEVIVPAPYWVSYPLIARMLGGVPVEISCAEEDRFRPRAEVIKAAITPKTRWIVLNFPNNPTGAILEKEDLEAIAGVLREAPHVLVMCDEIYEHLTFDGRRHLSLLSVAPDLADRILIVNGVAKAYAMTGWRVGFACGPKTLISAMVAVQGNVTSGVCTLAQAGSVAALDGDFSRIEVMRQTYETRRNRVVAALKAIAGVTCEMPEGAFYAYPGIASLIGGVSGGGRVLTDDVAFAEALLDEAHVATVPGSAFGYSPYLRLSCAASDAQLDEACERISRFVEKIRPA